MFVMWAMQREGTAGKPGDGITGGVGIMRMPVRELLAGSMRYMDEACCLARVQLSVDSPASSFRVKEYRDRTEAAREVITSRYCGGAAVHKTRK